jgi:hypothetical protein
MIYSVESALSVQMLGTNVSTPSSLCFFSTASASA